MGAFSSAFSIAFDVGGGGATVSVNLVASDGIMSVNLLGDGTLVI